MKYKGVVFFIFLAAVLVLGLRWDWLALMEKTLVVSDPLKKADVIVVPSGSSTEERISYAAQLYREGYAPVVLLAGHMALQEETGIDLMKVYSVKLGVKETDILREPDSDTTWMNAVKSWKVLRPRQIHSILIVTSPHHTRRAKMLFERVFPKSIEIRVAAEALPAAQKPWYRNESRVRSAIHEYLSFIWFYAVGEKSGTEDWT